MEEKLESIIVVKRDGKKVAFDGTKVAIAIKKGFDSIESNYSNEDINKVLKELKESAGFIRGEISKRVEIRHTPELNFMYDTSLEYAKRIEDKIKEINENSEN